MPPRSRTKPGSTNRRPKVAGLRQHAHAGAAGPGVDDDLDALDDSVTEAPDTAVDAPASPDDEDTAAPASTPTGPPRAPAADTTETAALPRTDQASDAADTATADTGQALATDPATTDSAATDSSVTGSAETDSAVTGSSVTDSAATDSAGTTETPEDAPTEAAGGSAGAASTVTRAGKVRRGSGMAPRAGAAPTTERPRRGADDTATASPTRTARPVRTGGRRTEPQAAPRRFARVRERLRTFGDSRALPVTLVAVLVVCLVLAGLAFWQGRQAWTEGPVSNQAVIDVGGTAELVGQSRESIEKIFSYDFSKLDDSVDAARTMSTGQFTDRYLSVFDQTIRQPAQQQQLRQTATVVNIGVVSMRDDRAEVIALTQFSAQRTTTGQSTNAPGLLRLQMERVDGRWKLAELTPLTANR